MTRWIRFDSLIPIITILFLLQLKHASWTNWAHLCLATLLKNSRRLGGTRGLRASRRADICWSSRLRQKMNSSKAFFGRKVWIRCKEMPNISMVQNDAIGYNILNLPTGSEKWWIGATDYKRANWQWVEVWWRFPTGHLENRIIIEGHKRIA
jgi:hypothetical protein